MPQEFDNLNMQKLSQEVDSFGAGIGFGIQIFCNNNENNDELNELIFDGGAGGGGGYNWNDFPNVYEYGGGGGIQINNISIGGGTGYQYKEQRKHFIIDPNSDEKQFYEYEKPFYSDLVRNKTRCNTLRIISGGGSGAGFTSLDNITNLAGWSYFAMNFTLE